MGSRSLLVTSAILSLLFIVAAAAFSFAPRKVTAAGNSADLQCTCQMDPSKQRYCPTVACQDMTSGFSTAGVCATPGVCKAMSTGGGGLTDISKLMEGLKGILDAMKGQPGGGGAGASTAGCTNYVGTSTPSTDPCSYYVPTSDAINTGSSLFDTNSNVMGGSGSAAASSLISSLSGSNSSIDTDTNTNTNPATNVSSIINANTSNNTTSGTGNTTSNTNTQTQTSNLNPGTNAAKSQAAFGSSPGIAGDVQILTGNKVTVLASNRDVVNGRQTTGFYGYSAVAGQAPQAVYTSLCALRPWASNFLSFIIPSNYLDSLCSSHGFVVGMPVPTVQITQSNQSSGSIVPKATASAASSSQTTVPQYLGVLRADIWATPPSVSSGTRTSIFWDSRGALTCAITSNDSAFTGSSLSGHASSQPITKNTTFSINCQNATSTVSNQVVVTAQ